ncbi:MAG: tyrosine-type recombinase/integrase [Oscillospiraceae bacterium]|nr:tyrosine-type recombinase/integrase [Oscillospiraceae bacterium]
MPITPELREERCRKKEKAKFVAKQFDREFKDEDYIFVTYKDNEIIKNGHFVAAISTTINYLQEEYNIDLKHFSPRYLRHTFSSRAMRDNISLETLKNLLGHSSYDMIDKIYSHSSQDDKINAITAMLSGKELMQGILK